MRSKPAKAAMISGALAAATMFSTPSAAFGLRTHLYIGQQLLADAVDCHLTLPGFLEQREIRTDVCDALKAHPGAFMAGVIGPDAFPDIVIGQSYIHPGGKDGRKSADWFEIMLQSASTPEELAFAYGNLVHASADIFAHSYVNNYAGGVFDILSDRHKDIELRHFVLEKYIDQRINISFDASQKPQVPQRFVVDTLIETNFFSDGVTITQDDVVQVLRDPGSAIGKEFFTRLSSGKAASHAILMQTAVMIARSARKSLPCEALEAEYEMVKAHRAYLSAEAVARADADVERIDLSFDPLPASPACAPTDGPLDALLAAFEAQLNKQVAQTARLQTASDAIDERLAFWKRLDNANRERLGAAYRAYVRAVEVRNEKLALARFAEAWVDDVELAAQAYVQAGLDTALLMVEQSAPHPPALHARPSGIVHYNRWTECYLPVFFGQPYAAGIATCERLQAMGEPLSLPGAALKAGMGKMPRTLAYRVIDLNRRIDAFFMRWAKAAGRMVAPSTVELLDQMYKPERITREKLNEIFKEGRNGQLRFTCVADWIDSDLGMVEAPNDSPAATSPCMEIPGERQKFLNPDGFMPLVHAITLSKIALLDREGMIGLANAVQPGLGNTIEFSEPTRWKPRAPRVNAGRYSGIIDTPVSIDGSYQWQGYAMPYPREAGYKARSKLHGFGYPLAITGTQVNQGSAINSHRPGFAFYQSEALRRGVFARLFPKPFEGQILGHQAMQPDLYPFAPCVGDPFRPTRGSQPLCLTKQN